MLFRLHYHIYVVFAFCGLLLLLAPVNALSQTVEVWKQSISDYKEFLGTLDTKEKESVLEARDEFLENFSDAPEEVTSLAFRSFEAFFQRVVFVCNRIYFFSVEAVSAEFKRDNRYKQEYQDLLNTLFVPEGKIRYVTTELLQNDPLKRFESMDEEAQKNIRDRFGTALDELYEFKQCGMSCYWGEGNWYLMEEPEFILSFSSILKGEYGEFVRFIREEAKQRVGHDATLIISWDELRQRIIRWDSFMKSHPNLTETESTIKPQLHRLMECYLTGVANTSAYDIYSNRDVATIDPELQKSYETYITENRYSSYYLIIQNTYNILKDNNFKYHPDLGILLTKNGYRLLSWMNNY